MADEATDMKTTRKRGRSDGSPTSSAAAVTPPETGRGQRKNVTQTSPSQVSPELPPRKTRRGTATPDTPQRTSPRGRGGGSPVAKDTPITPRGRGRRTRRGSTDSSASSVGTVSVASSSTPTPRRGRRGSSSSGVSAASENSQITPRTRQTGRGRKRNKSNSPPSVLSKKTNGASPQYASRNTKRRKGAAQVGTSLPAANGRNGRRTRGRGGVSETPPQEDLDGGTDDEESSHLGDSSSSVLQNSSDSLKLAELETPELPGNTSCSSNDVGEGSSECKKLEICRNLNDTYDKNVNEDHGLHRSEAEQNSEKESNLCKEKHTEKYHDDDIPIDSDKIQRATIPVAVCVNERNKNDKDAGVSVPDSERELGGKHCRTNIPESDRETISSKKHEGASITESDCENEHSKHKGTSVPETDSENKHLERHEGTDIPESLSVNKQLERHEGTNIPLLDSKNECSGKHQAIDIPILECESGHGKKHVDTNIPASNSENDTSETCQKSNSPVSKSVRHEDANTSLSNSIPTKLKDVAENRLRSPSDAQLRTCDVSNKCEVSDLSATTLSSTNSSSRVQSAKRRQTSGESSDSESPEVKPKAPKKAKLSDSVPDVTNNIAGEKIRDSVIGKCERSKETDKSDLDRGKCEGHKEVDMSKCLSCVKEKAIVEVEMDSVTKAETFLASLALTHAQTQEVCSALPADVRDSSEARIVEVLVETLLNGSTTVRTMNAPHFNKFLRQLLTHYCNLETTKESKHALCEKAVQWAHDRKSVNLRHELELTLMSLYYSTRHYKQAEVIASALYSETKKLQDKEKTVKACLCLSQVYHAMGNISKARANITTAKTEALKIYTPPDMQGELDLQSGIMQVAEGKDMETAYSYFKEAATGFTSRRQRARALKYMLLSKIMVNRSEEGEKAVRSQSHVQDIDEGVEAMLAITSAANRSSLSDFRKTLELYGEHLGGDMVVASVLDDLYITMMEKNLLNIILPYERLQIVHIADRIGLPREEVERRLSQMILDKRINAQLDHRDDCLYVYASEDSDVVYQEGIDILSQLDKTVSHLNRKVKRLL
ncbi:uncharacterized protein [Panulirus ornatus]|uniref:uncharacterized protein isoform X2 n=1 Tax=Panulirus ornatus TaxID=150431 RepID=UPI003A8359E8